MEAAGSRCREMSSEYSLSSAPTISEVYSEQTVTHCLRIKCYIDFFTHKTVVTGSITCFRFVWPEGACHSGKETYPLQLILTFLFYFHKCIFEYSLSFSGSQNASTAPLRRDLSRPSEYSSHYTLNSHFFFRPCDM